MNRDYGLAEIATEIADANGWREKARSQIHRQLKHWRDHGFIEPTAARVGKRGADLFSYDVVFRARLLLVFADLGLDLDDFSSALSGVAPRFQFVEVGRDTEGEEVKTWRFDEDAVSDAAIRRHHLDQVTEAVRSGETWFCHLTIMRDVIGSRVVSGRLSQSDNPIPPREDEDRNVAHRQEQRFTVSARVVISLADIFAPLLSVTHA